MLAKEGAPLLLTQPDGAASGDVGLPQCRGRDLSQDGSAVSAVPQCCRRRHGDRDRGEHCPSAVGTWSMGKISSESRCETPVDCRRIGFG